MIKTDVYFENIEWEIIKLLRNAKESVRVCVAWVNRTTYGPVFHEISERGVKVEIIINNDSTNENYGVKSSDSFSVFSIDTRSASAFMHNKFCVIDDEILVTGSYNWSAKASASFENIVVIRKDYKLVKAFLHEFYDLVGYYHAFSSNSLNRCHCGSHQYNLAILGSENGKYDESKIDIWTLCVKYQHVNHIGEQYEQYLYSQLGIKYAPEWDDKDYDKYSMRDEFRQERNQIISLHEYCNNLVTANVHAIGVVNISNWNEHIEYGEAPDYVINMIWRDMYYRKIIPDVIYDDAYGGVNDIISEHV